MVWVIRVEVGVMVGLVKYLVEGDEGRRNAESKHESGLDDVSHKTSPPEAARERWLD